MMTPNDLVTYYQQLLIMQYRGRPNAAALVGAYVSPALMPQTTVQTIAFSATPNGGTWTLSWNGNTQSGISNGVSAATLQGYFNGWTNGGSFTVTGSMSAGFTVTMTGWPNPPAPLITTTSALTASGAAVTITIAETDVPLLIAIRDAFNLTTSIGSSLDILAKYVGVLRNFVGFTGGVSLSDSDFRNLIQMGIILNNASPDLSAIQTFLNTYFPGEVFVFDHLGMRMSYLISSAVGSQTLVQAIVDQGMLPKPMGVQLAAPIYNSVINKFFGCGTYLYGLASYSLGTVNREPFNNYSSYNQTWPWLSYAMAV